MKTIALSKADAKLNAVVGSAQKEHVVFTREGKPSAVLIGIESYDAEDRQLASSPEFWQLIQSRRTERTIPLEELKSKLLSDTRAVRTSSRRKSAARNQRFPTKRKR